MQFLIKPNRSRTTNNITEVHGNFPGTCSLWRLNSFRPPRRMMRSFTTNIYSTCTAKSANRNDDIIVYAWQYCRSIPIQLLSTATHLFGHDALECNVQVLFDFKPSASFSRVRLVRKEANEVVIRMSANLKVSTRTRIVFTLKIFLLDRYVVCNWDRTTLVGFNIVPKIDFSHP